MILLADPDFAVLQRCSGGILQKNGSPSHPVPSDVQIDPFPGSGLRVFKLAHQLSDDLSGIFLIEHFFSPFWFSENEQDLLRNTIKTDI